MTNEGYFILSNDEFGRKVADNVNAQYKGTPAALTSNPKTNYPLWNQAHLNYLQLMLLQEL